MPYQSPETLGELIEYGIRQVIGNLWTASPAEVQAVDSETKRISARIIPIAIDGGEQKEYPIISNVPVLFAGGGGYTISAPLAEGDKVLLVFCRRGIANFKNDFEDDRQSGGMMGIDSAVAIPCFGDLSVTPSSGLSLQKEDGSVKVEVLNDSVKMQVEGAVNTVDLTVDETKVEATSTSGFFMKFDAVTGMVTANDFTALTNGKTLSTRLP